MKKFSGSPKGHSTQADIQYISGIKNSCGGGIRGGNVSLTLLGGGDNNEKRLRNSTQGFVSCVFACSPIALRTVSDDISKAQSERLAPDRIGLPGFSPWL